MQSKKVSKKTQQNAEETMPPNTAANEATPKPRSSRSSKSKSETVEATAAKHRTATVPTTPEIAMVTQAPSVPAKTMAAAAAAGQTSAISTTLDPVGVDTSTALPISSNMDARNAINDAGITHERIAVLAHSYWLARGGQHGSPEEDWLNAERELRSRR